MAEPYRVNHEHKIEETLSKVAAERRSAVTFCIKGTKERSKMDKKR